MKNKPSIREIIFNGIFDTDPNTSLLAEVWGLLTTPKGSYAKEINKILKWQSEYRLGKYSYTSMGEVWNLLKSYKSKITNLDSLRTSIQDTLAKKGTNRKVSFLTNPLQLILYHQQPKSISFYQNIDLLNSVNENTINAFLMQDKKLNVCSISMNKEKFSHGLLCGITGSGKTVLMKDFIFSLAVTSNPKDTIFYILNPKNTSFDYIDLLPHLGTAKPSLSLEDIDKQIIVLHNEISNRLVSGNSKPEIYVFVDELSLLSLDSKNRLTEISALGRSLGIHLILATQRPTKESIPTLLKSQLTFSLTGMVSNSREAYYASGQQNSNADKLTGSGSFILNAPGYENVLVQALMCEKEEKDIVDYVIAKWGNDKPNINYFSKLITAKQYPKFIESRLDWYNSISTSVFTNIKQLQDSHKQYYGKTLNTNTAKDILSYRKNET